MTLKTSLVELWTSVLIASLEGAALIIVVLLIQRLLKRPLGPTWSFALWFVVLLRLSLPTLPMSLWNWPRPIEALRAQLWAIPSSIAPALSVETETPSLVPPSLSPSEQTPHLTPLQGFGHAGTKNAGRPSNWASTAACIWVVGIIILVGRHWLGVSIYRRKLGAWPLVSECRITQLADECRGVMGITRPVDIRAAADLETPCLFGVFRTVLLVPTHLLQALSDLEWRNILLHEFAHLRRRDPFSNAWMSLAGIVHWFNPLVWWAIRRMRQDREFACDQLVLARAGQAATHSYGATLLKLASYPAAALPSFRLERIGILEGAGQLKARLRALKVRPMVWLNAALGTLALGLLGSCALTRNPNTAGSAQIDAINLVNYTDYPRSLTNSNVLVRRQDDPGMWSQIPHGEQTFFGVPFDITGLVRLAGRNSQRLNAWYFRPEVSGIPIGRSFDRLYLLHTTSYYEEPGTVIAKVRLNYTDGRAAEIPIAYGTHTLNYWRQRYENTSQLTDSDSRVAWTGKAPQGVAEYGNSLRLVVSSLKNPHPKRVVQSADLISTWSDSSEIIVCCGQIPAAFRQRGMGLDDLLLLLWGHVVERPGSATPRQ